jgi:UDP-glucose 4-epimerase
VDDAVDAFLRAGAMDAADGQVFNLGGQPPVTLLELARLMVDLAGQGSVRLVPFPPERRAIDIGDFYAVSDKARRELGWQATVPLREGLARTIAYYQKHKDHYL